MSFRQEAGLTRLDVLEQRPPLRVLFPRPVAGDVLEAAVLNTGGGLVGGDRLAVEVTAGRDARASLTTPAAEKVYRSTGADVVVEVELRASAGSWLEWLPQETILFDRARLRRTTRLETMGDGRLLFAEITVFGRRAMGERFQAGLIRDRIEVRHEGRLRFADILRLQDAVTTLLNGPLAFAGAAASGLLLYTGPDAPAALEALRSGSRPDPLRFGATCLRGVLLARWLDPEPGRVRRGVAAAVALLRAERAGLPGAMPRMWSI